MRYFVMLFVLFTALPSYGQTLVKVSKEDQKKYGLKKSVGDKYLVFTQEEAKEIRKKDKTISVLKRVRKTLRKEIDLKTSQLKAAKEIVAAEEKKNKILEARSVRLNKKYNKCLDDKASMGVNWVPWAITAASIAVALVGCGTAGYYMAKDKLK